MDSRNYRRRPHCGRSRVGRAGRGRNARIGDERPFRVCGPWCRRDRDRFGAPRTGECCSQEPHQALKHLGVTRGIDAHELRARRARSWDGLAARLLDVLAQAGGGPVRPRDLGEGAGVGHTARAGALGELRRAGLVDGTIHALPLTDRGWATAGRRHEGGAEEDPHPAQPVPAPRSEAPIVAVDGATLKDPNAAVEAVVGLGRHQLQAQLLDQRDDLLCRLVAGDLGTSGALLDHAKGTASARPRALRSQSLPAVAAPRPGDRLMETVDQDRDSAAAQLDGIGPERPRCPRLNIRFRHATTRGPEFVSAI